MAAAPPVYLPSDVSVTLSASQSESLRPGEPLLLTVSATNYGPAPLTHFPISSVHFHDEFDTSVGGSDCLLGVAVVDDGTPYSYYFVWDPAQDSALQVGETRYCHITMALSAQAPPITELTFGLPTFYLDPNPSNDRQTVFLRRALDSIPTTSHQTLLILAGLLATSALAVLRRYR